MIRLDDLLTGDVSLELVSGMDENGAIDPDNLVLRIMGESGMLAMVEVDRTELLEGVENA